MFENLRRGRQARNFTTNVPKILDLKSSSEQIFFRKLSLGAPDLAIQKSQSKLKILSCDLKISKLEILSFINHTVKHLKVSSDL